MVEKQNRKAGANAAQEEDGGIKRSRKSKMKKRPPDWEALKVEIAKEIGLWPKVEQDGWSGLSAVESGRLGGVFSKRKKAALAKLEESEKENENELE